MTTKLTNFENLMITLDLVIWRKWMDSTELWPRERNHAACAVEFHGAASERNHAMYETHILGGEMMDITKHLSLGVVLIEDGMRQIFGCTL